MACIACLALIAAGPDAQRDVYARVPHVSQVPQVPQVANGAHGLLAPLAFPGPEVPPSPPFQAMGLEVVGHNDLDQHPGSTSEVTVLGRTAYVGYWCSASRGTSVVDVSDPARPAVVFQTPILPSLFADDVFALRIRTPAYQGDLLIEPHDHCVRDRGAVTRIWNVDDPVAPVLLATFFSGDGVHNVFPFQRGDRAFVVLAAPFADRTDNSDRGYENRDLDADLAILEITDPRQPKVIGRWNVHDELGDDLGETFLHDIWVNRAGTLAYAAYWDSGLILLDFTDLTRPKLLGQLRYPPEDEGNTHVAVPSADERYVVLADEDWDPTASLFQVLSPSTLAGVKRSTIGGANVEPPAQGELVWVGRGCDADPNYGLTRPDPYLADARGKIAVVVREGCTRAGKVREAQKHGALGIVIVNDVPGQAVAPPFYITPDITIPGANIGYDDGRAITLTLQAGTPVRARLGLTAGAWGYTRIVDVQDPRHPRQVAEYTLPETRRYPPAAARSSLGYGYSAHNLWVDGNMLYVSHYDAGIRQVDLTDPTHPNETAYLVPAGRMVDGSPEGATLWGVVTDDRKLIFGSDMTGGLWILREPRDVPPLPTGTDDLPPTATSTATRSPTQLPPTATPGPALGVCPQIRNKAPAAAINAALANPRRVKGYGQLLDPGKPPGPGNPLRLRLSIHTLNLPYSAEANALEFKAGCP